MTFKRNTIFSEEKILLKEQFYWTNELAERLFNEKTYEIDRK